MPQIQCLPPHVADLIAAGEVVERPASVIKELLENAIDAGASAIVAEIEHGGLTYIRITDNGCGIPAEQLPTAFLRHATSKLRAAADLAAIGTLGFRGEALAAIARRQPCGYLFPRRRYGDGRGAPSGGRQARPDGAYRLPGGHHHLRPGSLLQHPRPDEVHEEGQRRGCGGVRRGGSIWP